MKEEQKKITTWEISDVSKRDLGNHLADVIKECSEGMSKEQVNSHGWIWLASKKTLAESILKNAMSKKYCGSTYFDYLVKEELPLIYKAMEEYSKPLKEMMNKILAIEDAAFGLKGFDTHRKS